MDYKERNESLRLCQEIGKHGDEFRASINREETTRKGEYTEIDREIAERLFANVREVLSLHLKRNDALSVAERRLIEYWLSLYDSITQLDGMLWNLMEFDAPEEYASRVFLLILGENGFMRDTANDELFSIVHRFGFPVGNATFSDEAAQTLLKLVSKSKDSRAYAIGWISHCFESGQIISKSIADLIMFILCNPIPREKRGPKEAANALRNFAIKAVCEAMRRKFDLPLERNPASPGLSIGQVVAKAANRHGESISESAVRKIALAPWAKIPGMHLDVGKIVSELFPTP